MPELELFEDRRGREPVAAYIQELERRGRHAEVAAILRHVELVREAGPSLGMPYSRMIDRRDRIFMLRPGPHRVAYAIRGSVCILLHAWRKRAQALDQAELEVARRRLDDWLERKR